jgi:Uma2 family endonuclease
VIICGEPEYYDKHKDIVLNPTAVIEVLSESTESFERSGKFMGYRNFNPTLTDYILVSQDKPLIEHYTRQSDGSWILREYFGLNKNFTIASIDCSLNSAEVFDRVEFAETDLM